MWLRSGHFSWNFRVSPRAVCEQPKTRSPLSFQLRHDERKVSTCNTHILLRVVFFEGVQGPIFLAEI